MKIFNALFMLSLLMLSTQLVASDWATMKCQNCGNEEIINPNTANDVPFYHIQYHVDDLPDHDNLNWGPFNRNYRIKWAIIKDGEVLKTFVSNRVDPRDGVDDETLKVELILTPGVYHTRIRIYPTASISGAEKSGYKELTTNTIEVLNASNSVVFGWQTGDGANNGQSASTALQRKIAAPISVALWGSNQLNYMSQFKVSFDGYWMIAQKDEFGQIDLQEAFKEITRTYPIVNIDDIFEIKIEPYEYKKPPSNVNHQSVVFTNVSSPTLYLKFKAEKLELEGTKYYDFQHRHNIIFADFDGDNYDELVFTEFIGNHRFLVHYGEYYGGTWHWEQNNELVIGPHPSDWNGNAPRLLAGDFNGNGKEELLIHSIYDHRVHLYEFTGNTIKSFKHLWTSNANDQINNYMDKLIAADLNGDGKDEVIGRNIANTWQTIFYFNSDNYDNGTFKWLTSNSGLPNLVWTYSNNQIAGDVDNDGRDEIMGWNADGTEAILCELRWIDNHHVWVTDWSGDKFYKPMNHHNDSKHPDLFMFGQLDCDAKEELLLFQVAEEAGWATANTFTESTGNWTWNWGNNGIRWLGEMNLRVVDAHETAMNYYPLRMNKRYGMAQIYSTQSWKDNNRSKYIKTFRSVETCPGTVPLKINNVEIHPDPIPENAPGSISDLFIDAFPTTFNSQLNIRLNSTVENFHMNIYNNNGSLIESIANVSTDAPIILNTQLYTSGMYIIECITANGQMATTRVNKR